MPKIAVIADTDASLSPEFAKKQGITLVPILINFGSESFASGVDIDDKALFERIDKEGALPKTAAPSPGAFSQAFKKEFDAGAEGIVCVCVSSEISATYAAALTAKEDFPGREIRVIDSRVVSMAQGFMALEAKRMADGGASLDAIDAKLKGMEERLVLFASLSTLKYLAMGGRVGKLSASMGNILSIRPILTMKNGKLDLLEKVRTRKAAMSRLVELLAILGGFAQGGAGCFHPRACRRRAGSFGAGAACAGHASRGGRPHRILAGAIRPHRRGHHRCCAAAGRINGLSLRCGYSLPIQKPEL